MNYDDLLLEAMDTVSAWNVPEECFAQAVADRIQMDPAPEIYYGLGDISPYSTLRFQRPSLIYPDQKLTN